MSHKKYLAVLPCAVLWAAMPAKAGAQEQQQGMVVARDAQTGQLRPATPAEIRALTQPSASARMNPQTQPVMVTHPGGSRRVRLGERGLVYSLATRGPDGKLVEQCIQGQDAVEKAVRAPSGAVPASTDHEGHRHE